VAKTKIEWCEETWNLVTGCTKISEGCRNCYAEKMHKRLTAMGQKKYAKPFNQVVFHSKELNRVIGKNKLVFVNSMSDTFHKEIQDSEINWLLTACKVQPFNQFQILTKRADRLADFVYPENVWLGVTIEKSKYKNRIDYLKQTNAKIKFLSCEPLLDDLGELDLSGIDWVIAGGESGHHARPTNPEWVRHLQKQCAEQKVPFFFKQWGEWSPYKPKDAEKYQKTFYKPQGITEIELFPFMYKVGKPKAGALIDGKEYKEFPAILGEFHER